MYANASSRPVPIIAASAEPELELTAVPTPLGREERVPAQNPQSPTSGIAIRELTAGIDGVGNGSDTHVLVVQPDGRLHVGVDIEKWAAVGKLRELLPETPRQASTGGLGWVGQANRLVLSLPNMELALLRRRLMLWYFLMAFQFLLYIVILVLCITNTSSFSGPPGSSFKWNSGARRSAWLRDFTFPFGTTEMECIIDVVVIMALAVMGVAGAVLYSPIIMTFWILASLVILALGAATTLSPVIVLRLVYIVIGFQVRAGVVRWRITHVGEQPTLRAAAAAFVAALSCCWCFGSRQRPNSDIRIFNDVESGGHDGGPPVDGDTASRMDGQVLPNQIPGSTARLSPSGATTSLQVRGRHYGNERELIWNNGLGLERDSVILQNATRARVTVDDQGRRTLVMSGLGG